MGGELSRPVALPYLPPESLNRHVIKLKLPRCEHTISCRECDESLIVCLCSVCLESN